MIRKIIQAVERVFHFDEFGTWEPPIPHTERGIPMTGKHLLEAARCPVAIKPLEWSRETPYHVARVFGNVYVVEAWDGGATLSGISGRRDFATFEEAKAAAQSDYETRIRSALVPPAVPGEVETLYRWRGPKGGWIYDAKKPSWHSEKLEVRAAPSASIEGETDV